MGGNGWEGFPPEKYEWVGIWFSEIADKLSSNEAKITKELIDAQGQPMNIEGYYFPNEKLAAKAMRPSSTLNRIIDNLR